MMAKTQPGASNIFNITNPELYRCQIYHYHARVSRLYLRVYKGQHDEPVFYILFSDVAYFECPVNWQGADFHIEDHDVCINLMLEAGLVGKAILQFPAAYSSITDYVRLYAVETSGKPIRIIASSASLLQRLPPELT